MPTKVPSRRRSVHRAAAIACVVALAACSSSTSGSAGTAASGPGTDPATSDPDQRPDSDSSFGWTTVGDGLQEGRLEVPIDAENPDGATFTLFVERRLATGERIGSLLVNPGGPGYGGASLAEAAEQIYGPELLERFDIVGWDPRGTGASTPAVDCVDDYDPYFSIDASPDDADEQQAIIDAATRFGDGCTERSGAILPFVSTAASARDMDAIRRALGEDTITYFGFSYGSELGVTWATMFPNTVRAMVIDGSTDQTVGYLEQNLQQAVGFESTFDRFLERCARMTACAFHNDGNPRAAFTELSEAIDRDPVPTEMGRPDVTQGVLLTAVSNAMYSSLAWPELAQALDDLQHGDGRSVLALYDDYYERHPDGTYDDALEAYFAINCLDDPGAADPAEVFAFQRDLERAAPTIGPTYVLELAFCAAWPVSAAPAVAIDAAGAGPILVVGTTGDPATPLDGTRRQADALEDGHLVVVTADQHTGYGVNRCIDDAVHDYLVDLTLPVDGLTCP